MSEVSGPFNSTWDMTHVSHSHTFAVGDRVVWLDSLEWADHWEIGTITLIADVGFTALHEVHTLATIAWDEPHSVRSNIAPLNTTREGLTSRGGWPVTIGHLADYPDAIESKV